MSPVCARFNCQERGAASLLFDNDEAQVLVVDLTDTMLGLPVCARHLKTSTPPIGWELVDQRSAAGKALSAEVASESETAPAPSGSPDTAQSKNALQSKEAAQSKSADSHLTPDNHPARRREDSASNFRWDRQARKEADKDAKPEQPTSPLLSRAFGLS